MTYKEEESMELTLLVDAYIAAGGKIEVLPYARPSDEYKAATRFMPSPVMGTWESKEPLINKRGEFVGTRISIKEAE